MPAQVQHRDGAHLLAAPFGTDQAMGKIGFAGGGATGLGATDVDAATLPRHPAEYKGVSEKLWLYFYQSTVSQSIYQGVESRIEGKSGQNQGAKREDGLTQQNH